MSKSQFDAFYQKVAENAELKDKLMSLRGTSNEVFPKICQIAQDEGYDVELADVEAAFSAEGELDDSVMYETRRRQRCTEFGFKLHPCLRRMLRHIPGHLHRKAITDLSRSCGELRLRLILY